MVVKIKKMFFYYFIFVYHLIYQQPLNAKRSLVNFMWNQNLFSSNYTKLTEHKGKNPIKRTDFKGNSLFSNPILIAPLSGLLTTW